jgi:hypothetical protein
MTALRQKKSLFCLVAGLCVTAGRSQRRLKTNQTNVVAAANACVKTFLTARTFGVTVKKTQHRMTNAKRVVLLKHMTMTAMK